MDMRIDVAGKRARHHSLPTGAAPASKFLDGLRK
jgi:hypothetical protein